MKISLNTNQWFDGEGKPLSAGRISVYVHGTNIYKDIFTLDGSDNYSQATNPLILDDAGRAPTVWFDASTVDVLVEAYNGIPGSYDQVDTYQDGFDLPDAKNDTVVYGITGLEQANPELGCVTVVGFNNEHDCGPRMFVWDPTASENEDGCAIVRSDSVAEGRWILLSDERYMPSSWYGIVPGTDEGNLSAFLTYPETVGQWSIKLPPVPRFLKGTYTSAGWLSSTKSLSFDTGAKFALASFVCRSAEVMPNTDFVADFEFTGTDVTAHSGWFRTVQAWWHCDARTFAFDSTNHFMSTALTTSASLNGKVLTGNTRVGTTYSSGMYIQISNCLILGRKLFSPLLDYLRFSQMEFTTDWFTATNDSQYDFGLLSDGHRLDVRTFSGNTLDFENFAYPNIYYKARLANGDSTFDGHGAYYTAFTVNNQFTAISNCRVPSMVDHKCGEWNNVFVEGGLDFSNGGASVVNMNGCSFYLATDLPTRISAITLDNCNVRTGSKWRTSSRISVYNSVWAATCELPETAKTDRKLAQMLSFDHCTLGLGGNYIWTNNLSITHCTSNAHVYLVPYEDNGAYYMAGTFVDNMFVAGALIECNVKDMSTEYAVRDVHATLVFKDNRFNQDDTRGIVIPWLTQEFDILKPFLSYGSMAASTYRNNTGNCPKEEPTKLFYASEMVAAGGLYYLPPATYRQRVWNMNPASYWYPGLMGIQFEPSGDSWNKINGRDARAHYGALMHIARQIPSDAENDQFGVVHAWEANDGFDSDLEVFYF